MTYCVWCSVEGCRFEAREIEDIDRVFDVQDEHTTHFRDHHVLDFQRLEVLPGAEESH